MPDGTRLPYEEVITRPPTYGVIPRETISHHAPCQIRGRGTRCGCDPIRILDFIRCECDPTRIMRSITSCSCARG